jgi:UDP-N-acetylmuramoyl-L-alanyl-D-glutamate--2,6-diaminopimelate ligase
VSQPLTLPGLMIGVTGTNGKTSVTQWIAHALGVLGQRCAIVGTLGNGFPEALAPGPNTTPGAHVLRELLPAWTAQGAKACAMEVSSIGLHQNRVAGLRFDIAVFTNFTRDHLDYHPSMAEYAAMKRKLFEMPGLQSAVINLDDAFGRELAADFSGKLRIIGYTLEAAPDLDRHSNMHLRAEAIEMTATGVRFRVRDVDFAAPVVGMFNVSNLLAVIGALLLGGETLEDCAQAIKAITPPPGRMQTLGGEQQPLVVVDYAHTPDALEKVLNTLRVTATARGGRLCCVFGCGGDRDAGKRPQMGAIAEQLADRVVVTSDNPRSEDPLAIMTAILAGMTRTVASEPDRARAIATTIAQAGANDVILIAGKGHEPYQEIAGVRHPFSDLAVARSSLSEWHAC